MALAAVIPAAAAGAQHPDPAAVTRPLNDGDRILVKIWVDTTFADTVRVTSYGTAMLPRIGQISVAGLPPRELTDSLLSAYAQVFSVPAVEITPLIRVAVVGEVNRANIYFLEVGSRVRDAVAIAGGLTERSRTVRVALVREGRRSMIDWVSDPAGGPVLLSGDAVIAERERWISRNVVALMSSLAIVASVVISATR